MRVFIVDDEEPVRRFLVTAARMMRCEAAAVGTIGEAIASVRAFAPDVVVVDMVLPDGNGLALARGVRDILGRPVRVVLASGAEGMRSLANAMEQVTFLRKPFTMESLAQALRIPAEATA
jgi:DNA-binding response OmpR family regulator